MLRSTGVGMPASVGTRGFGGGLPREVAPGDGQAGGLSSVSLKQPAADEMPTHRCFPPTSPGPRHQANLLKGQLYDMMDVDDQYDAAASSFIRGAVADEKPFFFYFSSHHSVRRAMS